MDPHPEDSASTAPAVVVATPADLGPVAEALADAFFDDPVMSWILKEHDSRPRRLALIFSVQLRAHYLPLGTVWTTPRKTGAALWAPPGHAIIPPTTVLRNLPEMLRGLGRHAIGAIRALNYVERRHPKEPHWYLGILGTRKADQGKGVGSSLLAPILDRCDEDGIPAFLESSKQSNISFYRRHGFEVTGEITLPAGGPTMWPMWRDPRPR